MNRFVVPDWDAAFARLISRAPDSGEFTWRVEMTVCTDSDSSFAARSPMSS